MNNLEFALSQGFEFASEREFGLFNQLKRCINTRKKMRGKRFSKSLVKEELLDMYSWSDGWQEIADKNRFNFLLDKAFKELR